MATTKRITAKHATVQYSGVTVADMYDTTIRVTQEKSPASAFGETSTSYVLGRYSATGSAKRFVRRAGALSAFATALTTGQAGSDTVVLLTATTSEASGTFSCYVILDDVELALPENGPISENISFTVEGEITYT